MELKQKIDDINILKNWNQQYNKPESKLNDSITRKPDSVYGPPV